MSAMVVTKKNDVKGLSNVQENSLHGKDIINRIYNTFPLIDYVLQQVK